MLKSKTYRRKMKTLFHVSESYRLSRFRYIVNTDCGMRSPELDWEATGQMIQ